MRNHLGIIGYGIMAKNIIINLIKNNINISIFNKEKILLNKKIFNIILVTNCLKKFISSLPLLKLIFLIIKTGFPIKLILFRLKKKLFKNDIVIDFGNSFYKETFLNNKIINKKYNFISSGISGGANGALYGLCCMMDCSIKLYEKIFNTIKKIFFLKNKRYSFCLSLGLSSSHYIKMIHNGIEYGILQLISEIYFLLKNIIKKKKYIINVLLNWNNSIIGSYLLKILLNILLKKKKKICDIVDQKGTGRNFVLNSIKNNINANSIFEALIIRIISKNIFLRKILFYNEKKLIFINKSLFLELTKNMFLLFKLLCYSQGLNQLIKIKKKYNWKINLNNLIKSYFDSCIIDSKILFMLINIKKNFFLTNFFLKYIKKFFCIKKVIFFIIKCNLSSFFLISCFNLLTLLIYKNYNIKLIQFERNYFGNHIIKYI
ncbi:NAD(P)-binding domain-containing protein [Candidatus Carsonella ruddii]|uniref:NAD(P)-binding domain-containing protein n=1 Tax=Carsonella ruddii TaxID=114186 RepID=UPI00035BF91E|nr:NAD(P)-binding domain-containing protein [Candidatus Carsonella ruddii]AGS06533.1 6-phosphogluconate dehydrogenase [Candidatus Carsonella ruddii DC]ALA96792.1 hypothetical protein AMC76_00230 [Candidatus Carsonella ruddii]